MTVAATLQAFVHLSALFAKAIHVASLCTLSRLCGDQLVSLDCCFSGSDSVRVVTSAHQRIGVLLLWSLG